MCEKYRISLMALVDGELAGPEREELEEHLSHCAYCNEEYNDILQVNLAMTEALSMALPAELELEHYSRDVCRKLEPQGSWAAWSLVSLLLVFSGSLLIFGCRDAALGILAGTIALAAGAALAVVSYFCNSCSR